MTDNIDDVDDRAENIRKHADVVLETIIKYAEGEEDEIMVNTMGVTAYILHETLKTITKIKIDRIREHEKHEGKK